MVNPKLEPSTLVSVGSLYLSSVQANETNKMMQRALELREKVLPVNSPLIEEVRSWLIECDMDYDTYDNSESSPDNQA